MMGKKIGASKKNKIFYICLVCICLFQIFWIVKFKFYVQSDDFGYIANAAFFAGYNWNNYTGDMTPYYNIGFSCFPAILLRITSNPTIVYRLLLGYILLLQVLSFVLVYRILIKFLNQNLISASIGAFVYSISIFAPQSGIYYMSEVPYALSLLIILYLLLSSIECNERKKIICSAGCGAVLAYSYSIHTRFLVSVVVVFLMMLFYRRRYKKHILNVWVFLFFFCGVFIITYYWVRSVQEVLYKPTEGIRDALEVTANDALTRLTYIFEYTKKFLRIESWKYFFLEFFSLMGTYTILTGGMIWLMITTAIDTLGKIVIGKLQDRNLFVLTWFGLVSFLGMNCLVAANGVMNINEAKWLTFIRYSRPYVGVLFVAFFSIWWGKHINRKDLIGAAGGSLCSLLVIVQYVGPIYEKAAYPSVSPVGWMRYFFFYVYQDIRPINFFMVITQMSLFIGIVLYSLLRANKNRTVLFILIGYSLLHTISENQWNLIKESDRNYEMVDGTIKFMEKYGNQIEVPLYFVQGTYSGKLRFGLFSYEMKYILDNEDLYDIDYSNAVLFSDQRALYDTGWQNKPKGCFELDKYEYVYTSNIEIMTILSMEYERVEF